ncbi:hypothetical protein OH146_10490 [Salinibacterium sp. SYSU T00001]|uniref:hypothetical protein n=1 Tax=Homoserinimonas sedimenticola TaxID=2986805 RepID=UPI002236BFD2|nr:hypothetical protein [Salinibacterium sedimenticola]MCW4386198.1 hypothetical protein [Salinibacterium sedimenticola]
MPELVTTRPTRRFAARVSHASAAVVVLGVVATLVGCSGGTEEPAAPPANTDVGKAFTSEDGLAVSVTRRICGISGVGEHKPEFTPVGQYCTVGVNVDNGTGESVDLTQLKVSGFAADTQYFPDYWAGNAADGGMIALEAGESIESTLFFDVPKGQLLESVTLTSPWEGIESFEVSF